MLQMPPMLRFVVRLQIQVQAMLHHGMVQHYSCVRQTLQVLHRHWRGCLYSQHTSISLFYEPQTIRTVVLFHSICGITEKPVRTYRKLQCGRTETEAELQDVSSGWELPVLKKDLVPSFTISYEMTESVNCKLEAFYSFYLLHKYQLASFSHPFLVALGCWVTI